MSSAPLDSGARCRDVQTTSRVSILIACRRPYFPSESGRGRRVQRTLVERLPRPPSRTGFRSMQDSTSGTYRILESGLYEPGIQLLAPPACGQITRSLSSPGRVLGSMFFFPVVGSMDVTMFCRPRSLRPIGSGLCWGGVVLLGG